MLRITGQKWYSRQKERPEKQACYSSPSRVLLDLGEILVIVFTADLYLRSARSQRPRGEWRVSLCRAYSAPAIRSNLHNCMKELHERIRGPNFVAKVLWPTDFSYALLYALRRCIARLRYENSISCSRGWDHRLGFRRTWAMERRPLRRLPEW
jgi:hypothetical protein